jgi:uncharacterized protein YbaA (DUF1428 family)
VLDRTAPTRGPVFKWIFRASWLSRDAANHRWLAEPELARWLF